MKATLLKQGQIEPLQVHKVGEHYVVFHDDAWGNEIVFAARELGWSTLLITNVRKYGDDREVSYCPQCGRDTANPCGCVDDSE